MTRKDGKKIEKSVDMGRFLTEKIKNWQENMQIREILVKNWQKKIDCGGTL